MDSRRASPFASFRPGAARRLRDDGSLTGAVVVSTVVTCGIIRTGARSEPGRDDSREDIDMRKLIALAVSCVLTVASVSFGQVPQYTVQDSPAAFLAALNAWRAQHGRGPVGWDSNLAAWASRNTGIHAPGSSGGAAQCWAGTRGYLAALRMWQTSGPHAAILLSATTAIGVSPCPTGMTCNAR